MALLPGPSAPQQGCPAPHGCSPPAHPAAPQVHSLQELRRSASLATKVFVQRDYSDGTTCQFQTKFPPELESRIERQLFEETVKTLNGFYAEAEKIGGSSYLEGCLACATAYFIFLCMETHYEKVLRTRGGLREGHGCRPGGGHRDDTGRRGGWRPEQAAVLAGPDHPSVCQQVLKKISKYIQEQNEKIYAPRGLLLTDPLERGMRVIEISIYEDRCSSGSSSSGSSSSSSGGGGAGGR
ncbi:golgin subfamily A member 7B isoform 2-T2 [Morphnus guianensis]